jgi:hypothetical protein
MSADQRRGPVVWYECISCEKACRIEKKASAKAPVACIKEVGAAAQWVRMPGLIS